MVKKVRDKDSPTFKDATAKMNGKEKIGYIWEYYKLHILGSIALVLVVGSIVHALLSQVEDHLYITFLSGFEHTLNSLEFPDPDAESEQATDHPEPPLGIWVNFEVIETLEDLLLDDQQRSSYQITVQTLVMNFETIPVLTTHTGASVIDMIVTHIPDLHVMSEIGHFKNIADLGWDIPEYIMHNEYGIYLRYFTVFDGYVAPMDDLVLGISATTRHLENVENFFEILLD